MHKNRGNAIAIGATVCLLAVALVAVVPAGCGSETQAAEGPLSLTETDNGKTFTVKAGGPIEVVLPGNPTTGYAWTAALTGEDAALLELVEDFYEEDPVEGDVVGSGGVYTFTFRAAAEGTAQLKLIYARSFEPEAEPDQTFEVTITIEG